MAKPLSKAQARLEGRQREAPKRDGYKRPGSMNTHKTYGRRFGRPLKSA